MQKLDDLCERLQSESLMLEYADDADLVQHVDVIVNRAVSGSEARAEALAQATPARAEVWPRVDRSERVRTDTRGRVKTEQEWRLVLSNTGAEPARKVRYRLEQESPDAGVLPETPGEPSEIEVLAPRGEASYVLFMHSGVADQARCVVTWEDSAGEHENVATLRFF